MAEFNAFEHEERLFERCVDPDGVAWWDAVRYSVQFRLCEERALHRPQRRVRRPITARAFALVANGARLLRGMLHAARLDGSRRFCGLYLYRRYDKVLASELEAAPGPCLVVKDASRGDGRHFLLDKRSVEMMVKLLARFCTPPAETRRRVDDIVRTLDARFAVRSDLRSLILAKWAQLRAGLVVWKWILGHAGDVPVVGFIGDDSQKPLVMLARQAGIRTREFQHGYIGGSHINYSYPEGCEGLAALPDEIVVSLDTGDIRYPVPRVPAPQRDEEHPETRRDIDVLVGGSPTRVDEAFAIADAVLAAGFRVAVKLHPNQSVAGSGFRERYAGESIEVFGGDVDFRAIAARSKAYVPANPTSTTSFEAVAAGSRLVVVDFDGVRLTSAVDGIAAARVDDPAHLPVALRSIFQPDA